AVRVVDLDERLPLVRERVLREDRLDRTLRFACAAVADQHPTGQRKRVIAWDDGTKCFFFVRIDLLDAHHSPMRFTGREVEPADRAAASAIVRLAARLFARPNRDVARERRDTLEP